MAVEDPERASHPMCSQLECLASPEFSGSKTVAWRPGECWKLTSTFCCYSQAFKQTMASALTGDESPLDANLERVLPGVHQWHQVQTESLTELRTEFTEFRQEVTGELQAFGEASHTDCLAADQQMAEAFRRLATAHDGLERIHAEHQPSPPSSPVRAIQTDVAVAGSPPSPAEPSTEPCRKRMQLKHPSLEGVFNEWNGLEEFEDACGGIKGREEAHGSKWRNQGTVNPQHFSRTKRVILGAEACAHWESVHVSEAVAMPEADFAQCKHSVANFCRPLICNGLIEERPKRAKKSKSVQEQQVANDSPSPET